MKRLVDPFQRKVSYLRISITDRCNLRCQYCTPLTPATMMSHQEILRYEEILRIVRVAVQHGVTKVRITGGEPLVRLGVYDFLEQLTKINGLEDISLTTNGVLLPDHLDRIKAAGVKRLNISLDSISGATFRDITGRNDLQKVWQGIELALQKGFDPVKINMVVLKGVNDHELLDFAELSIKYPLHIRFIEYMPIGISNYNTSQQMQTPEIKKTIATLGSLIPVENGPNDGPAQRFRFENARGELGFISPISHHFCSQCCRLRLTANGKLRSCLLSEKQLDLKEQLRKEAEKNKGDQYDSEEKEKELNEHLETMTQVAQNIDDDNRVLTKKHQELKI